MGELERKVQENVLVKRERDELITEIHYLKSQLKGPDHVRMSMPVNSGPFEFAGKGNPFATNGSLVEAAQVEELKRHFEKEKEKLIEQRTMAEDNCIKVG